MSVYAIWPYFLILVVTCSLFSLRCFAFLDPAPQESATRATGLDGIRGFLALSVMIDHAIVNYHWLKTGDWIVPPAKFYDQLGTLAVAIFFMITGFLFWGKAVAARGRIAFVPLYINRLFRIAPVYLLAVLVMVLVVFARTDFVLNQPVSELLPALGRWSALGLGGAPDFNGYSGGWIILAGVTWTLEWEWYFYFSLLLTAAFARIGPAWFPACALACFIGCAHFFSVEQFYFGALFASGMVVAGLRHSYAPGKRADAALSALALLLLGVVLAGWSSPWGTPQVLMAGVFFYLICSGTTLFGLLRTRAAQRLGHISFSIYMLQGLVLTAAFADGRVRDLALGSVPIYWLLVAASVLALTLISAVTYVLVEQPGIRLGKRIGRRLAWKQAGGPPLAA